MMAKKRARTVPLRAHGAPRDETRAQATRRSHEPRSRTSRAWRGDGDISPYAVRGKWARPLRD
jgi:hypothetical protein